VWGTWYYPLLPTLAARTRVGGGKEVAKALEGLGKEMRFRVPPQKDVARQAKRSADLLERWLGGVRRGKADTKRWADLLGVLARQDRLVEDSWESATQVYLGLAALYNGLGDLDRGKRQPGLKKALEAMRRELERAFPGRGDSLYDSPSGFAPGALLRDLHGIQREAGIRP
jgi:hypothetical protein